MKSPLVSSVAIGVLSMCLLMAGLSRIPVPTYDEPSYVGGARAMLNRTGIDLVHPQGTDLIHPPLAEYFIAAGMKVFGDNPVGWRVAGAAFGSLTLVAVYLWVWLLFRSQSAALTAAGLTLLNNFLFVMSRVAMLDVFYFAFVMFGVLAFTAAVLADVGVPKQRALMLVSGVMFGCGVACKWVAAPSLCAVILMAAIFYVRGGWQRSTGITIALSLVVAPVATYVLAYLPLCYLRHGSLSSIAAMNAYIWKFHVACGGNAALDVKWYRWFFRTSPERGLFYLVGNPAVVWVGLLALVACAWNFVRTHAFAEGAIVLMYAVNLLQWVAIPQKSTCYYYYYPPAMFLGAAIATVLHRKNSPRLLGVRWSLLLFLAAAVVFVYCYPRMASLQAPYDCAFGCWS